MNMPLRQTIIFIISFFKKLVYPTEPNTKASAGLLKSNQDVQTAPADPLTEEQFSMAGDYGLKTLSENSDDIIE